MPGKTKRSFPHKGDCCPAALYRRSALSRERDVHLKRYLESRGWKLYRVWSSAWWHDAEREVRRIRKAAGL